MDFLAGDWAQDGPSKETMLLFRGAECGLWIWQAKVGRIVISARGLEALGVEEGGWDGKLSTLLSRLDENGRSALLRQLRESGNAGAVDLDLNLRICLPEGGDRWVRCRGTLMAGPDGRMEAAAGSVSDITDWKITRGRLRYEATHDSLTQLPNRSLFLRRLERAVRRSQSHPDHVFAVLFVDLDRFKRINDSLGHAAGDELLFAVARRMESCLRPGEMLARLGGDEFTVFLDSEGLKGADNALMIAERLRQQFAQPFAVAGQDLYISASIGVAMGERRHRSGQDLLRDADIAMYQAKAQGKDRCALYTASMKVQALEGLQLGNDLRRAVENGEFFLHYQPIVSLRTGNLSGFEAMVRWSHPQRGILTPNEFIPMAEETGIIISIGEYVFHEACRQLAVWHRRLGSGEKPSVSINFSPMQFRQPNMTDAIARIIHETGVDPSYVRIEITESAMLEPTDNFLEQIEILRAMKIQLQIDDFGTGYSSLSYLHRYPFDALKIDRSFVSRLDEDVEHSAIIYTIAMLAHHLGLTIIAEGVETEGQLKQLMGLKCGYAQGFLIARPLDAAAAEEFMVGRLAAAA